MAEIRGIDVVVSGLDQFGVEVREAAYYAVIEALQKAFEACRTVLSESDHTLRQLAEMGHPYSAAHGYPIHDPDILVHVQSGAYRDSLKAESPVAKGGDIMEGKIVNESPLDEIIQNGSLRMRARPWMQYIIQEYGNDLADLIEARISAAIARRAA